MCARSRGEVEDGSIVCLTNLFKEEPTVGNSYYYEQTVEGSHYYERTVGNSHYYLKSADRSGIS